jgi:hypothetical protein
MQAHAGALNEAYTRLLGDSATWDDQQAQLEDSGKKWLEEMSGLERKRKTKKTR